MVEQLAEGLNIARADIAHYEIPQSILSPALQVDDSALTGPAVSTKESTKNSCMG